MVEEAASEGKITEIKSAVVDARFSTEEGVPPRVVARAGRVVDVIGVGCIFGGRLVP